jgi:hypothetical protein
MKKRNKPKVYKVTPEGRMLYDVDSIFASEPAQKHLRSLRKNVRNGGLMVKAYTVLERAVEDGVRYGYFRAFKHTEKPGQERIIEEVSQAVMNEICEWFSFAGENAS